MDFFGPFYHPVTVVSCSFFSALNKLFLQCILRYVRQGFVIKKKTSFFFIFYFKNILRNPEILFLITFMLCFLTFSWIIFFFFDEIRKKIIINPVTVAINGVLKVFKSNFKKIKSLKKFISFFYHKNEILEFRS